MRTAILYQKVDENSKADDIDVLAQKNEVGRVFGQLGFRTTEIQVDLNLEKVKTALQQCRPDFVFNLVESIDGHGQFIHFVPALLEQMAIPFTGSTADVIYLTTDKILSKERMTQFGINTPAWIIGNLPQFDPPYIIKPVSEDASVDIDEDMVVFNLTHLESKLNKSPKNRRYFIEKYIPGREFNLSMLASDRGPQVLPPAELCFVDYPPDKVQVVGYKAKWQIGSFEYNHTVRRFENAPQDKNLHKNLEEIALQCWNAFSLRGYARVDFRVDKNGDPWILEVNANPCISPDSGFVAAAEKAGLSFKDVVKRIVADSFPASN